MSVIHFATDFLGAIFYNDYFKLFSLVSFLLFYLQIASLSILFD